MKNNFPSFNQFNEVQKNWKGTHSFLFLNPGFDERVESHSSNCNGCSYTSLGANLVTCVQQLAIQKCLDSQEAEFFFNSKEQTKTREG